MLFVVCRKATYKLPQVSWNVASSQDKCSLRGRLFGWFIATARGRPSAPLRDRYGHGSLIGMVKESVL